jgi:hypothetical protein
MAASMPVTSGQRRAAAKSDHPILLPHFAAESSSRAFASTLSAALCRSVRAVGVGGRGLLKPCAWERVSVVVGCRLPWRIPIDGEGRQPCRVLGNLALLGQDGSAQRAKWSPAGRSTADCSSSGPWPPSSPLLRVAVYSPELRQRVRSVRNNVSGVCRLLSPASKLRRRLTDDFLRRHARRQTGALPGSVR